MDIATVLKFMHGLVNCATALTWSSSGCQLDPIAAKFYNKYLASRFSYWRLRLIIGSGWLAGFD